ncbi:Imm59 family immunity protein [Sporolactobacillus sp. CQH2019]|uniref:Imm59 family immunity protein n=1 Tax=Sporolactobacillus sp. CQH2019 TaxID=3023512 RepID=UPI0023688D1B|nr:Imm59 family immunity protein [Sporolactobacillus sp. CQH2019]MDD9149967.1 Imm59 family immunity protein [Sporolactobacillus sp. CQH2019]
MLENEAKKVIADEKLKHVNWFDEKHLKENQVGIKGEGKNWYVYVTDERASVVTGSVKKFDSQEKALDNFIKRAMTEKKLFKK